MKAAKAKKNSGWEGVMHISGIYAINIGHVQGVGWDNQVRFLNPYLCLW